MIVQLYQLWIFCIPIYYAGAVWNHHQSGGCSSVHSDQGVPHPAAPHGAGGHILASWRYCHDLQHLLPLLCPRDKGQIIAGDTTNVLKEMK